MSLPPVRRPSPSIPQYIPVAAEFYANLVESEQQVLVYPNPASGIVNVPENGIWKIVDLTGREVMNLNVGNGQINVGHLPANMYIMEGPKGFRTKLKVQPLK